MHLAKALEGWSKSALASEFEIDRRTVDKVITDVAPNGSVAGKPVYRMKDVAPAFARYMGGGAAGDVSDPESLNPKSRKDWYDGEDKRLIVAAKKRELLSRDEIGEGLSMVMDSLKTFLVTIPDVLERDADLNGEQVQLLIELCDKRLGEFVESLVAYTQDS